MEKALSIGYERISDFMLGKSLGEQRVAWVKLAKAKHLIFLLIS
ncbi:hypothetical protein [Candidatus Kryptonium thompsonii]|nr:hypothetical protein [Candidatus Kryptonium thompsoni]